MGVFTDAGPPSAAQPGAIPLYGSPAMKTQIRDAQVPGLAGIVGRHRAAAAGAVVILALASGTALGFTAVMDRVAVDGGAAARGSTAGVSEALLILPAPQVVDPWFEMGQAARGRSRAHVVDRGYDVPAVTLTPPPPAADPL